ncbi:Mitotic spindle checkpoint component mad2 [Lodderomyces elongisporus]|uniref:Mitotic spindle checkpoint component mad2 n=1 Tax=Lodderomyces elongisporus TaxID=36914 RepID=UPI0029253936|nr:Mitotic spindle checkpoint component mad2 [Lodderomyces elongisporus]WLF77945.1 Mitotic spindle checkpoint component mad2 [Lodderomyces elongisporus]
MSASKLALKGSSKIVSDYFEFAINSILFQRGIYPAEDFVTVRKYDLPMLINNDDDVKRYISNIMQQLKKWIYGRKITKLIVVILSKSTGDNIERWEFDIDANLEGESEENGGREQHQSQQDQEQKQKQKQEQNQEQKQETPQNLANGGTGKGKEKLKKSKEEIQKEIRAIIRQITSSVSYLPVLHDDDYTFNVLVYTDPETSIPIQWCDTHGDGRILEGENVDQIEFASFSTDKHKVKTSVSYKYE